MVSLGDIDILNVIAPGKMLIIPGASFSSAKLMKILFSDFIFLNFIGTLCKQEDGE